LDIVLGHQWLTLLITATTLGLTLWLYTWPRRASCLSRTLASIQGQAQGRNRHFVRRMSVLMAEAGRNYRGRADVDNVAYWITRVRPQVSVRCKSQPETIWVPEKYSTQVMARVKTAAGAIEGLTLAYKSVRTSRSAAARGRPQYQ